MGGRGSSSRISNISTSSFSVGSGQTVTQLSVNGATPIQVATNLQAQRNNNANFKDTDDADYHQLYNGRQYYANQSLSIDQRVATMNYLSDVPAQGSLYSMSQNMNYKLTNGQKLNANEQYTYNNIQSAMHNLGYNLTLSRYDHEGGINTLLSANGIKNSYDTLTQTQLKKALVGTEFQTKSLLSTSYNDFSKGGSGADVFTSRAVKFVYNAKAKTQAMMPGNGPGGNLGEIILSNKNTFKVTDVKFDGRKARKKGTQNYTAKGVTIYVDVE